MAFYFLAGCGCLTQPGKEMSLPLLEAVEMLFQFLGFFPIPFQFLKARLHTGAIAADYE